MRKLALLILLPFAVGEAHAFCRKTTVDPDPTFVATPTTPCWTEGLPLYWRDGKASYAIQKDASTQVSLVQTEDTMALAFSQWTSATCGPDQKPVSLEVRFDGPTPNRLDATDRTNVVMFDDALWPHSAAKTTLALTTVTFDTKTGELIDADLEVNTANVQLSTTDTVPPGGNDFQSIVTHESGHFLGLAHSIDPKATMFASYTPGTKSLRTLAADDVDGICAIYPPGGCSCTTTPTPRDMAWPGAIGALTLLTRRARRRR